MYSISQQVHKKKNALYPFTLPLQRSRKREKATGLVNLDALYLSECEIENLFNFALPISPQHTFSWQEHTRLDGLKFQRMLCSRLRLTSSKLSSCGLACAEISSCQVPRKFAEKIFASARGEWARRSGATVSEDNKVQKQIDLCKSCVPLSTEGISGITTKAPCKAARMGGRAMRA